jgi:4-amino-4-deoxy-L-arabinose transferase-like glycosyltransferase
VVLVVAGLRFIDLGREDLGKDEALWCIRAKAVAFHDEWLDTTPHSVGKLMVSSYPPLHAWMTGALYRFVGADALTSRLVSAAAAAATVLLIYLMGSMAFGRLAGFLAALTLGLNVLFFKYSRLGQLEALYLFTIVAALWFYMLHSKRQLERMRARATDGSDRRGGGAPVPPPSDGGNVVGQAPHHAKDRGIRSVTWPVILCGIAFGLALLSKIATGLFVPIVLTPYLVYLVYNRRRSICGALAELGIIAAIGLLIAAPWHVAMMLKYSAENPFEGKTFVDWFWNHHIVERSARPLEGLHHSGYGWGHLFYLNSILVNMPFIVVSAFLGIVVAIKASITRNEQRMGGEFRMLFLLWAILTFAVLERSATRMSSYVITLVPPRALFAGWTLGQLVEGRIGVWGRTLLLGLTLFCVAYMADQRAQDALETVLGRTFGLPVENPVSRTWTLTIPAYLAVASLLAGVYHVFLSRKPRFARAATAVLVVLIVAGAAGKGTFGKLISPSDETTWETLRPVIPEQTAYDMVLSIEHWRDDRQVQDYLDGMATHWETRMFLEHRGPPTDWASKRDALVADQPYSRDGRWHVDAEAPLFDPTAWEYSDARLENLTDKAVVAILLSDDPVERKVERLLRERRVLVMLVEDSDPARRYGDVVRKHAQMLGSTKELSLYLSGVTGQPEGGPR